MLTQYTHMPMIVVLAMKPMTRRGGPLFVVVQSGARAQPRTARLFNRPRARENLQESPPLPPPPLRPPLLQFCICMPVCTTLSDQGIYYRNSSIIFCFCFAVKKESVDLLVQTQNRMTRNKIHVQTPPQVVCLYYLTLLGS